MAAKKRARRAAPATRSLEDLDDAWRRPVQEALREAIGSRDLLVLVDGLDGAPPRVVVSLAIAAPPERVAAIRAHAIVAETLSDVRAALTRALPDVELVIQLVPAAIETTPEMLALALDAAGRPDLTDALSLPPSSERDAPGDGETGRSFEVTRLRIQQIEATALRRIRVGQGRDLPPPAELLSGDAPATEPAEASPEPMVDPTDADRWAEWLPMRSLRHETAKPRFWLIARLGCVVSVRSAQRMRGLSEKRLEHADEARAIADFERRVAERLAKGYVEHAVDLADALLHHEDLLLELDPALVRRAARALMAQRAWKSTLGARAIVRALGRTGVASDRELASSLLARVDARSAARGS